MPMLRYDYDSVLERLKQRTLRKLSGQNVILFSTNSAWLEAASEEFDDLSMYDEFLTRENIWDTARGSSSIMKQAGFFDYKPHRKIGATGVIRFSASEAVITGSFGANAEDGETAETDAEGSWPLRIRLPKWTQVSGKGVTFLTGSEFYLPADANYVDVPVIQGEVVTKSITIEPASYPKPKGTAYAQIPVYDPDIENTLYEVWVNGELWEEIDAIRLAVQQPDPETAKVYSVLTMPRYEGVILLFGNDMLGKSLRYEDTVVFKYLQTKGAEGNILSAGIVTTVDSTIIDEEGDTVTLYCTNVSALTGGKDYESLIDIKTNAPRLFQTRDRAITSQDYETLIQKALKVDKVRVWGEKELNEDLGNPPGTYIAASENLIYITGYIIDSRTLLGVILSEGDKHIIRAYLNDRKGTTDILQFVDTQIVYVTFRPVVFIKDTRYTLDQIKEFVHNALVSEYSIYKGEYGKGLYLSDYYSVIDGATGVDHCTCALGLSVMALFKSAYAFTTNLHVHNIKKGSVSIKIRNESAEIGWHELAHDVYEEDSHIGSLQGSPVDPTVDLAGLSDAEKENIDYYQLPAATINYHDGGIGNVLVTFGLTEHFSNYQIRIDFKLDDTTDGDLILTLRNQLFAWYANDITTRLMD